MRAKRFASDTGRDHRSFGFSRSGRPYGVVAHGGTSALEPQQSNLANRAMRPRIQSPAVWVQPPTMSSAPAFLSYVPTEKPQWSYKTHVRSFHSCAQNSPGFSTWGKRWACAGGGLDSFLLLSPWFTPPSSGHT